MHLVKFENWKLTITEEALLVSPFAALWKRDKSKHKEKALQEFGIIYFLCDPRSDYMFISDEKERLDLIKTQEGLPKNWKIDAELQTAINTYKTLTQTTASLLLEDTRILVDKIRQQMKKIDLNLLDDKRKPVYTLQSITSTVKQIPQLSKDLTEAEIALNREIEENGRIRGQKVKTILEDGLTSLKS